MSKVIKIIIGIILLGISAFYFLGICLVTADAKEDAVYNLHSYIQVEQIECEYLGKNPVINGSENRVEEGYEDYGFYRVTFEAENLSSVPWYGEFLYILDIDRGAENEEVGRMIFPPGGGYIGYFETVNPVLPGKTSVELVYYLEVKDGVDTIQASYRPAWDEEEIELDIVLN